MNSLFTQHLEYLGISKINIIRLAMYESNGEELLIESETLPEEYYIYQDPNAKPKAPITALEYFNIDKSCALSQDDLNSLNRMCLEAIWKEEAVS